MSFWVVTAVSFYRAGRPYAHCSETLNAFSSKIPKLRRLLHPAWDAVFAWRREEPTLHHAAMPWQVLVSLLSTALLWGWPLVAGALALARGGHLRIGDGSDLLLPSVAPRPTLCFPSGTPKPDSQQLGIKPFVLTNQICWRCSSLSTRGRLRGASFGLSRARLCARVFNNSAARCSFQLEELRDKMASNSHH